jgi:hypothetical protein
MSFMVTAFVEEYFSLSVVSAWNDRNHARVAQISTKGVRIVTFIGQQISRAAQAADQGRGGGDVRHVSGGEGKPEWAAEDIGERMDLARLATAGEADRLLFFTPISGKGGTMCLHVS